MIVLTGIPLPNYRELQLQLDTITNRVSPTFKDLFSITDITNFLCVRMHCLSESERLKNVQLAEIETIFIAQPEYKKTIIEDMSNLYPIHLWVFKNQEELELKVPLYVAQLHQQLDRLDRLNAFL